MGSPPAPRPLPNLTAPPLDDEVDDAARPTVTPPTGDGARVARFVVESYDRLGDQVAREMRSLQVQVDTDLSSVRSELANLRQTVGDVAERVQLRQLRGTIDQLRDDITALRRVVLEWPELEQVSADITEINAALAELRTQRSPRGKAMHDADVLGAVSSLREEVASLGAEVSQLNSGGSRDDTGVPIAALAPLIDEIGGLREEVAALKRRISLRASGKP